MSDILSRLSPPPGSRTREKRVGRGVGTGLGKTGGRGQKGQKARHGGDFGKPHFQGGQTPIQRRLPKRGFRVPFPIHTVAINVAALDRFEQDQVVDEAALRQSRLVQGRDVRIKILGEGDLDQGADRQRARLQQVGPGEDRESRWQGRPDPDLGSGSCRSLKASSRVRERCL